MSTTTIEDEMGWTKKDNYCSSSEDDDNEAQAVSDLRYDDESIRKCSTGLSCNTGPKGVLEDWRQFKKLESEKRAEREKELIALAKRVSLTCRSHREDEIARAKEEDMEDKSDDDDNFLNDYAAKRMREMIQLYEAKKHPLFMQVYELTDADQFIKAIDEDSKTSTVLLHLYENKIKNCEIFDRCLTYLAERYTMIKFCRVRASLVGASQRLRSIGLPAVLAYRDGQLIGNFVRIGDELDDDFEVENVEQYLKEFGVLPELSKWARSTDASAIRARQNDKSDTDTE